MMKGLDGASTVNDMKLLELLRKIEKSVLKLHSKCSVTT